MGTSLRSTVRNLEPLSWTCINNRDSETGEVAYLDVFGQFILLGTHQTAVELLEKHLSNYSDRIFSSMLEGTFVLPFSLVCCDVC